MEESAQQPTTPASKPTNWYSGWRVFATAAATFVAAKLFGVAGALVAALLFLWLQPKRGTWQALAAAAVAGVAVAAVLSVALLREQSEVRQPSTASQPIATDRDGKPCTQITEFLGECKRQP